ncbi:hypothetical protein AB0K09_20250 [Streptomyces sp. NPDC049577]|uniref:TolB family protein n=1 Tax=Streptomyces sp. NPDC049577 TaxID=3155153 RepID=UPI0034136047
MRQRTERARGTRGRRRRVAAAAVVLGACTAALPLAPAAAAQHARPAPVERVSVGAGGLQPDGESYGESIDAAGRLAVFTTAAPDMVPGGVSTGRQVFVRDLATGTTRLISAAPGGTPGNDSCWNAVISGNGRYVVFESQATDLAPGRNPGERSSDVFVHDLATGRTEVLIENTAGQPAYTGSPAVSHDGRFVAFASTRSDLVPGDTNGVEDVFVRDRLRGTTTRVSVTADGRQADGFSVRPVISADGSCVGFLGFAGMTPDSLSGAAELRKPQARVFYVHDLRTGRTRLAAATSRGGTVGISGSATLSPDGRYAVFTALSDEVVPGDTNGKADVFVRDLRTGSVRRASVASDGSQANDGSYQGLAMSADDRRVFFTSAASNLVPGDTNGAYDVFVRDLVAGTTERVSTTADGGQATGYSFLAGVSASGRTVLFGCDADNLVPGDTNKVQDVFVRRLR